MLIKMNSAVLLILFLLVAAIGWFAASSASPKLVTLLTGMAIGMIVTMPVTLLVARILWSEEMRAIRRRERHQRGNAARRVMSYPPVIVVPSPEGEAMDRSGPVYTPRRQDQEPPVIHYLGED
jgi:hypothetical protein